jgi:23S rRNA (adenine2503-C2)-methyltransferase
MLTINSVPTNPDNIPAAVPVAPLAEGEEGAAAAAGHAPIDLLTAGWAEVQARLGGVALPKWRWQQVQQAIWRQGVQHISDLTTWPKALRASLAEVAFLARPQISQQQVSQDGTIKWLLRLADGQEVECVFIPESDRGTLCVSSQVGCTLNCRFCHTGTQNLVRNLTAAEILGQVLLAKDVLGDWPADRPDRRLTNIVFMGMGEPLYNYEQVSAAVRRLLQEDGLNFSKRRVTLSTAGVVPMIARVGEELGISLAVSLHAARDVVRDEIVPLNRKYNIAELLAACRAYPSDRFRRITFEYVMLDGVNDSLEDARRLVGLLHKIPAKINLIPFNPWPGTNYRCSPPERIEAFADILWAAGLSAPIRTPRGSDILAACGQLKSASEKLRRSVTKKAEMEQAEQAAE